MLLTMMASTGTMWGQTNSSVTMAYSGTTTTNMTGNNDAALVGLTATDWSVVGAKGGNSNFPGLNKAGDIRLYYHDNGSNTVTVTALNSSYTITDIEITYTGTGYNNGKVYVGGNEVSGTNGAFDINATSFVVTNGNNSNVQVRISSIVINYSISGTPTCAAPTFSPAEGIYYETQNVTITSATDGATIYYTLNGNDPTTSSSVYSSAISITETTTVKAMAVKTDYNNSEIASATYTINEPSGETWSLVTSASDLTSGGIYVIACNTQNMVAGDISNSVMQNKSATFSTDKSHITMLSDDAVRLTLGLDGSNYTFANSSNKLLGCTAVKKLAWDSGTTTWSISFANNKMTMSSTGDGYGDMKYNNSSPRFTTYASEQTDIQLYRLEGGTITYSVTYNGNGNTGGTVPTDGTAYESDDVVTVLGNTGNLVKAGYIWAGWNTLASGEGTTYQANETFNISANTTLYAKWEAKSITNLTYTGAPTKTEYYSGESFDPTGLTVTATFNDDSSEDVTALVVWTPNPLTTGTTSVTGTYMELTVNIGSLVVTDAPGTLNNPYTVAQALENTPASGTTDWIYVHGIVSAIVEPYNSQYGNISYNISDDGENTTVLYAFRGKSFNGDNFTSANDVLVGDVVTICGKLKTYQGTKELDAGNYLIEQTHPAVTVEAPTFSPIAGTYSEAQNVTMSCTTEGAAIHYTTDGTEPDGNSTQYSEPISVSTTTTFKAKAIKGSNMSSVVTATYHINSASSPYTVAQALAFHEYPTSSIWVHGIVSTAPTQAPTNSGQLTYYISDDGTAGENNQLEVYKGLGLNGAAFTAQDDIQVGDIVTITGIVKIYSSTIEFDTNNQLTYFERPTPTVPTITVDPTSVEVDADEHDGTISVTYTAIETDLGVEIHWFETSTSTEQLSAAPEWIDADFNTTSIETIDYVIAANDGAARTAYFKVCGADAQTNLVYSELVTVTQAAAAQDYNLTVEPFENLELITFVDDQMELEEDGTIQVTSGAQVMLNIVADEGFVVETLMVNGVNHAGDISNNAYNFEMPSEDVTISATAVEYIPPVVGNYVRINDISYLTDGAKVIIAARYDEDNTNKYYAMTNATSGKPTGVLFTSSTENTFEILPSDITDEEDNYYWTVGITENGYTFTNANDDLIGYNSSTNFATGGNNTEWNIEFGTSEATAMVANYEAFTITNHNQNDRGFALNSSHNFGPYSIANYTSSSYNFYLDFFVQGAEPVVTPSITLSSYEINAPANETIEILTITPANIENFDVDNLNADYCNADGSDIEGSKPNFVEFGFSENEGYKLTCTIANNTGEARTAYFKVIYDNGGTDVVSNVVTVNQAEYVAPVATITVADGNANIDVDVNGVENATLAIAYENLTITENTDFDIQYYDENGDELGKDDQPDWMAASIQENATQDGYEVLYDVFENDGEARTAYFKVFAMGDQDFVYSNLVTINQAAYVVDYATLPFEWAGGASADLLALNGVTAYDLGTDYASNNAPYLIKFDGTGDYIQVKTNEQPGVVTIGVKMIGGASTSTLTVQGSSDGETFTDVEALTISGSQNTELTLETTNNFAATDRYVRLLFTKGSNVGVGPITIAQVDLTPSITVAPASLNLNCDGGDGELTVTHKNLADDPQLNVIFVESDGETITTCDWIQANINTAGNVAGHINANTGEARTAYLKVTGRDAENNLIKSNLVTFNQSAYTEPSIVFENTTLDIVAGGENRTMSFDYEGLGQDPTFSINFYESDGTTTATYDWIEAEITQDDKVDITVSANEGAARSAYFKVSGVNGEVNALSNLVTINQAAFVQLATYSLVTNVNQIVSGKHYLIASGSEDGTAYAIGNQNENNRSGVAVTIDNSQITETEGVYEFVINTHLNNNDEVEYYTIYDAVTPGYLYAASSSKNYLKTSTTLDDNGKWTIAINNNGATITAQGTNSRKLMRYNPNNNSPIFACYAEGSTTGNAPCLYVKDNDNDYEYYGMEITYNEPNIPDGETLTVGAGSVMTVPDYFVNDYPEALVIQEGGQLIHTNPDGVNATLQKVVEAYTPANRSGDGWYMIATPVDNLPKTAVASTSDFDLFLYNEPNAMWYAHWADPGFETLYRGKGYLYANAADVDLNYAGLMKATDAEFSVPLSYDCDAYPDMKGFNLVGNPFTRNLKLGDMQLGGATLTQFYVVNPEHTGLVTIHNIDYEIKPGEGFFVQATEKNQTLEFNPSTKGLEDIRFIKIVAGNENGYDNAYINIGCGNTLRKTNIANLTSVYVMDQGLDYSAARVEELAGNMPVHFAPSEDGFFTITVEAKNLENINFMHLIDNIENTAINLLAEPTYTFKAGTSDNEDRFTLVFDFNNYLGVNENNLNDSFVYQSGDELILNGEGTLQVFDMMGRFVMSKEISGSERISTSTFETGVYVLRFVGETVMTQKIVIE